jgi:hypothetical protein
MENWIYFILGIFVLVIAVSYIYYEQVYMVEDDFDKPAINDSSKTEVSEIPSLGFTKKEMMVYFGLLSVGFIFAIIFFLFKTQY